MIHDNRTEKSKGIMWWTCQSTSESLATLEVQDVHLYNNIAFEKSVYVKQKCMTMD